MNFHSARTHVLASLLILVAVRNAHTSDSLFTAVLLGLSVSYCVVALYFVFYQLIFGAPKLVRAVRDKVHEQRGGYELHLRGIHIHVAILGGQHWLRLSEVEQVLDTHAQPEAAWRGRLHEGMQTLPSLGHARPQAYGEAQALVQYLRGSQLGDPHFRLRLIQHIERQVLHPNRTARGQADGRSEPA